MQLVLPGKNMQYSLETLERVLNLATSGATVPEIEADTGLNLTSIYDRLNSAGIELRTEELARGKEEEIRRVCSLLERPTIADIAGLCNVSPQTAKKYMPKDCYKAHRIGKPPLLESTQIKIIEFCLGNPNCSFAEIAENVDENKSTVYKCLEDHGYKSKYKNRWPKRR
jgi:hypothetical protein